MLQITKVKITDSKALSELAKATFAEAYAKDNTPEDLQNYLAINFSESRLAKAIQDPNIEFYFAKLQNEHIAYLQLNFSSAQTHLQDEQAIEIERIYVLRKYYGQQIGKALLDKAIQLAQTQHKSYIWLGVWEKNLRALAFYKKHGFQAFGTHSFKLGDDIQSDIKMKLILHE